MKIHIRIVISIMLGVIGAYFNNEFLLQNNYINYETIYTLSPNLSKIKDQFELKITEKKIINVVIASQNIYKLAECKGSEIVLSSPNELAVSVKILWKSNKYQSISACEESILLVIRENAKKMGVMNGLEIIGSTVVQTTKTYSKLTPYLLFLIIGGAIFLLTGIKPK
jgi:hypothetical protein